MNNRSKNLSYRARTEKLLAILVLIALALGLCACSSGSGNASNSNALEAYPASDMSGYSGLSDYSKELTFVDVTMDDVKSLMDGKRTFVLYAGYANCPWCNALISYLNDAALENGNKIAYLDTRKDPSWESNVDIDGYDVFVEYFGEYLEPDADNIPHLYVPDVYYVKDGQIVARHEGVTPSLESPSDIMTKDQENELMSALREEFSKLG